MQAQSAAEIRQAAEEAYGGGYCCAEAVLLALAKAQGIDAGTLSGVATVFCSGMARTGGDCGALTGAMMGLGLALGRRKPGDSVDAAYAATQRLVFEFEQEFGARDCSALIGCDTASTLGRVMFRLRGQTERCRRITGRAAEISARILAERDSVPKG